MKELFPRILDLDRELSRKSYFLFGPRQVGKSTWMETSLENVRYKFDLLDGKLARRLSEDPSYFRTVLRGEGIEDGIVVVDEIQFVPDLLNEVHYLIEKSDIHFLLTGSSARKLRGGSVNLLGGRAGIREMFPLVYPETASKDYPMEKILNSGLIPKMLLSDSPSDDLEDYLESYLELEIQREGVSRNLPAFSRFLEVAALSNTEIMNYENISKEVGVSRQGVVNWFQVLYDTLLAFEVPAYRKTKKRKSFATSKMYFFDIGVARITAGLKSIEENTYEYGKGFENYIAMELRAYIGYRHLRTDLSYWRSVSGFEVDFILGDEIAIETKTTKRYNNRDLKGLRALKEEGIFRKYILVCFEDNRLTTDDGIDVMPWKVFLSELWNDKLITI